METLNQLLHAAADGDGTADVVAEESEGGLGEDLFPAPAEEEGSAVIVLDGAKRVFGNGHPFLLFGDVLLDGEDDAGGLFENAAKGVIVVGLDSRWRESAGAIMIGEKINYRLWKMYPAEFLEQGNRVAVLPVSVTSPSGGVLDADAVHLSRGVVAVDSLQGVAQ